MHRHVFPFYYSIFVNLQTTKIKYRRVQDIKLHWLACIWATGHIIKFAKTCFPIFSKAASNSYYYTYAVCCFNV